MFCKIIFSSSKFGFILETVFSYSTKTFFGTDTETKPYFTQVSWILAEGQRHFPEYRQDDIGSGCVGDNLSHGGSDDAHDQGRML